MPVSGPTILIDGISEASVFHGVARLTLGQAGTDGKPSPVGQLCIPLTQLPGVVTALNNLMRQVEAKAREMQAAQTEKKDDAPVSGAFRFQG